MLSITTIHHVSLPVVDLERSKRFYSEVLGLRELSRQSTFRHGKGIDTHDIHFAVRVDSYRGALEHLRSKGYSVNAEDPLRRTKENRQGTAGFPQVFVLDPDRNVIEINAAGVD
jgi:catechol 2,3-dioxygenase-like lactoylglutathione lyase family enzyme